MQFPGEGVDVVGEVDQLPLDVADPLPQGGVAPLGLDLQGAGLDGKRGQPLGVVVVELARQPAQFLLLGGDQPAGQGLQFALALAQGLFRQLAVAQVDDQADDQERLESEQQGHANDGLLVLVPQGGLAKENRSLVGHQALVDGMALELAPVVEGDGRGLAEVERGPGLFLAEQQAHRLAGRRLALLVQGNERPADDAVAHERLVGAEYRRRGLGGDGLEHGLGHEAAAAAVDEQGGEEDEGVRRQLLAGGEDVAERAAAQVDEFHPGTQGLERGAQGDGPGLVILEGAGDEHRVPGVGLEGEGRAHQAPGLGGGFEHTAHPTAERRGEDPVLKGFGHTAENDRHPREQGGAVFHEEVGGRHIDADQQVDAVGRVALAEQVGQGGALGRVAKAGEIQVLGEQLHREPAFTGEGLADAPLGQLRGREIVGMGVEDDDPLLRTVAKRTLGRPGTGRGREPDRGQAREQNGQESERQGGVVVCGHTPHRAGGRAGG